MVRRREENEAKKVKKRNWVKERAPPSFLVESHFGSPSRSRRSPSVPFLISPARFLASLLSPPRSPPRRRSLCCSSRTPLPSSSCSPGCSCCGGRC